jgi:hypothetical protein
MLLVHCAQITSPRSDERHNRPAGSPQARQQRPTSRVVPAQARRTAVKAFVIGALVVAVGVLGFLYWDSEHNTLVKAPGVEIKKN